MMAEFEENERRWNRKAALEEIDNLKAIRATSWEQHSHSFKWLMASLLAVNGGACLVVLDHHSMPVAYQLWAAGAFVVGLLAALLVAVFGQFSVQSGLAPLQKFIGYWITVVDDGVRDAKLEQELYAELREGVRWGNGARIFGWLSALAFVVGVVVAGVGMMPHTPSVEELGRLPS